MYTQEKKQLLELGRPPRDYENSVYTTWEISLNQIQILSATDRHAVYALELLRTISFMHFEGISEQIFERARKNLWDYVEGNMFSDTETAKIMSSGWNQLTLVKTLKILLDFSLITVDDCRRISMHPLVHEWSRQRMSLTEREQAWQMAVSTLAMSIYAGGCSDEEIKHKIMINPHIDACLDSPEGKKLMFADGLRVVERYLIIDKFAEAYEESARTHHALALHSRNSRLKRLLLPSDNPSVLYTGRRQAYCLGELCRYEEAVKLQESIVEIMRLKTGASSPEAIIFCVMRELAVFYVGWGKYEKGLGMLEEIVHSCHQTVGADDEITWDVKHSLAYCLYRLDRTKEAIKIQKQILQHSPSPKRIHALALFYTDLGKKAKARKLQAPAIEEMISKYGEYHPWTLEHRTSALNASRFMEKKTGIDARLENLEILEANLGELHQNTILAMVVLADGYIDRGFPLKSRQMRRRAVDCSIRLYGNDHPQTTALKKDLALIERAIATRKICYWWLPDSIFASLFAHR